MIYVYEVSVDIPVQASQAINYLPLNLSTARNFGISRTFWVMARGNDLFSCRQGRAFWDVGRDI